jgi:hypothetical protein
MVENRLSSEGGTDFSELPYFPIREQHQNSQAVVVVLERSFYVLNVNVPRLHPVDAAMGDGQQQNRVMRQVGKPQGRIRIQRRSSS